MNEYRFFKSIFLFLVMLCIVSPQNHTKAISSLQNISPCASLDTVRDVHQFAEGENDYVEQARSLYWSPDGTKIAFWVHRIDTTHIISDPQNWLHILDVASGETIVELPFDQYRYVHDIGWSPDSKKLAITHENTVRIWEGDLNWSPVILNINDLTHFEQVMWSADNTQLYTTNTVRSNKVNKPDGIATFANMIRSWDSSTGELSNESPIFEQAYLTKNGTQTLIISSNDEHLTIYDAETNQPLWSLDGYLAGNVFNEQVQRLATITTNQGTSTFSFWDIASEQKLFEISGKYDPRINFAPNGNVFQVDLRGIGSEIWDIEAGEQIIVPALQNYAWTGAFWNPMGDCVISTGEKRVDIGQQNTQSPVQALLLWDIHDPQSAQILDETEILYRYNGAAWSPDGQQLAIIIQTELPDVPHGPMYPSPPPRYSTKLMIWSN